jgi:hypothetical protein
MEGLEIIAKDRRSSRFLTREESNALLHPLMARAVLPSRVYAHDWQNGDLCIWDNSCVWHSATGGLKPDDKRLMHLLSMDGSVDPLKQLLPPMLCEEDQRQARVLVIVLGQSPREDLVGPVISFLNGQYICLLHTFLR